MVNVEKIHKLLRSLEEAVGRLHEISQIPLAQFLVDGLALGAAKYYLQTAIEACIDIGNHVISSEGFRSPRDYRDVFSILHEEGIVSHEAVEDFRKMAGLRNRLVHLYWEVDDELIYKYLQTGPGEFEKFARMITEYLSRSGPAET
jgi:uncharacterized protein YutE (UPF0331/DUF86 family)